MDNDDIMKNFIAALNHSISKIGYGAQRKIAQKTGITQQYISGIVSGKRFGKEEVRRAIAKACGYEYEDFLKFGESLIQCEIGPYRKFEVEEAFFWVLREICIDHNRFQKLIQDTGIEELRFKRIFNHLKEPHNPPPTQEEIEKIVKASNYKNVEEFMERGRQIIQENPELEWDMHQQISFTADKGSEILVAYPEKTKNYCNHSYEHLIQRFKNKSRAIQFIEKIIKLESLSEGLLSKAENEIDNLIELAEIMKSEQSDNSKK